MELMSCPDGHETCMFLLHHASRMVLQSLLPLVSFRTPHFPVREGLLRETEEPSCSTCGGTCSAPLFKGKILTLNKI